MLSDQFVPVEHLQQNSWVQSASGQALRTLTAVTHPAAEQQLVELTVECGALLVSPCHRVVTSCEPASTALAGVLQQGDVVLCTGGLMQPLLSVRSLVLPCAEVVEVQFDPDEPVAAFHPPSCTILTKGKASQAHVAMQRRVIRRGGMNRRSWAKKQFQSEGSIPGTYDEFA